MPNFRFIRGNKKQDSLEGITTRKREQRNDNRTNRFTLRQYFEAMRANKTAAIMAIAGFAIAVTCFATLLPYIFAQTIDLLSRYQAEYHAPQLMTFLLLALCTAIIGTISNFIGLRGFAYLDARAQNHIRSKVFSRLTHESATFYANTMAGSLTSNMVAYTNGYVAIQEIILQRGLNLFLPLVIGMYIIASQSLPIAGIFLAFAGVLSLKTLADSRKRAPYRRRRKDTMSKLNGFLGDAIANSATIRTFAGEVHEKRNLERKQNAWQQAAQANFHMFGTHYAFLTGSVNVLQVVGLGAAVLLAAHGYVEIGLVVFAISYFQRLSSGLLELGSVVQSFQGALMDAAPISEILMSQQVIVDAPSARPLAVTKGAIELNAVTYRYEPHTTAVFDGLSLSIAPGQSVGVVGRSGGGKTTLTNLLLRSADVEAGSITIDGQDISTVTQRSLRDAVSYVPQDSQLFHRSMRENIAYGKPDATDAEIIAVAKRAHIWELIQELPEGLDTKVGERGVKLSGGQRQRVAIARAILKNAPVLIFDEATSALDSESEQHIQASLNELIKGRTAIVIAHRLSTIQKLDRIIVLDKGRIVEDGSHAQLVKRKGLYATLWAHQSGGFMKE